MGHDWEGGWDMQSLLSPDFALNPLKASDGSSSVPRLQLSSYLATIPSKFQVSIIPRIFFSTVGALIVKAVYGVFIQSPNHSTPSKLKMSKFKDLVTETKMNFTMSGKMLEDAETHVLALKF